MGGAVEMLLLAVFLGFLDFTVLWRPKGLTNDPSSLRGRLRTTHWVIWGLSWTAVLLYLFAWVTFSVRTLWPHLVLPWTFPSWLAQATGWGALMVGGGAIAWFGLYCIEALRGRLHETWTSVSIRPFLAGLAAIHLLAPGRFSRDGLLWLPATPETVELANIVVGLFFLVVMVAIGRTPPVHARGAGHDGP